jgi:putative transposase
MRTFEYRLFVNKEQSRLLLACLAESRKLYNEMLAALKAQYEQDKTFPSKYDLTAQFKARGGERVPAPTVQMLADRLIKALKRSLAAKELGIPDAGFPRFKQPNRWHSISLRQYAISRDVWLDADNNHLHVPAKLGKLLKIKLHRPIEGTPKTVHLVHRADGHWYALIVCVIEPKTEHEPTACEHPAIGLDMGLGSFLTDSEGQSVENPRFYRTSQKTLRRKQRAIARRKQGSHRRRKAAKSIMDASWGAFLDILEVKAASAGHQVVRVNPRFTSQKSLSVRTHLCSFCGYTADREVNAAQNILEIATPGHGRQE